MIASLKFLFPLSLLIGAGEHLRSLVAAPAIEKPALATAMEQIAQPFLPAPGFDVAGSSVVPRRADLIPLAFLAIWMCGFSIAVTRWARGIWRIPAVLRMASPLALAAAVPVLSSPMPIEIGCRASMSSAAASS